VHNLAIDQLVDKVNSNEEIINRDEFDSFPDNIWYDKDNDIDNAAIKLVIPSNYIKDLLDGKYVSFHIVIAEAILYSMFKLGNEENPADILHDKLKLYHLLPSRFVVRITPDTVESILGGLEPDAASALKHVTDDLKMITKLTKNYGTKRIKQIANNMKEDLSFCFAYMSADIVELEKKDKTKKQQFLDELRSLIDKYSRFASNVRAVAILSFGFITLPSDMITPARIVDIIVLYCSSVSATVFLFKSFHHPLKVPIFN